MKVRSHGTASFVTLSLLWGTAAVAEEARWVSPTVVAAGQDLFLRDWSVRDPRSHGGDGLGPVFNERSCVACHNQGGPGGGGPNHKNVQIVAATLFRNPEHTEQLAAFHPGFRASSSVIVHRFGVDPDYAAWRREFLTRETLKLKDGSSVTLRQTSRNTPPIFGAGLIDRIPDEVLEEAAGQTFEFFPRVKGHTSKPQGGRVGRFGWKAQIATLEDFVLSACAGELGLEAPDHHQAADPAHFSEPAPGLDLSQNDAEALVEYVRALPVPIVIRNRGAHSVQSANYGKVVFDHIGCATCHRPILGDVQGIYSDLLLHDMGSSLSDPSQYYGDPSGTPPPDIILAKADEWRTPPLWGLRDSAPYLHDGRARTVEDAIFKHGGEAADSAGLYRKLSKSNKIALRNFLLSLAAPPPYDPRTARHIPVSHRPGEPLFPGKIKLADRGKQP